jgi:hypothetical protein
MTQLVIFLNGLANRCGDVLLAPIAMMPGWLSATLVAAATGVAMLVVYKYTSRQRAVQRRRDAIKANLLALSLFKDSVPVTLRCQRRIIAGAFHLLALSIVPMLVMIAPMCLLLAQLALWYQARPLRVGEEAVLTVLLSDEAKEMPEVQLEPTAAAEATVGPVHVPTKRMVCWNLRAQEEGCHLLTLDVAGRKIEKEMAVGDGFMPVSLERPARDWWDALLNPREAPLPRDSAVQSVAIDYPDRAGWTSGSNSWVIYWFIASMIAAFCVRPLLKVHI